MKKNNFKIKFLILSIFLVNFQIVVFSETMILTGCMNLTDSFIKNLILTDKIGYPQFYTQLVFEKNSPMIYIKTVINGEEATSKVSTCIEVELFEKES